MLTPAAHWGTHTQSLLTQLELQSSDPPLQTHPTPRLHIGQRSGKTIWAQPVFSKNMSGCLIPECPSPSKTFSSSKPKLKHFILGEAQEHTQSLFQSNEHLHLLSSPAALRFHCLSGTHTYRYSLLNCTSPREGIVSCVSLNFHPILRCQEIEDNMYVCWTI